MNKNILIALVVVLLAGGAFVLLNNNSNKQPSVTNTENQAPTVEPTSMEKSPSEEPEAMSKTETKVTLTSTGFEPKSITVKVGDKVVWINKSGNTATVDSAQHPTHLVYPKLNLGNFEDGEEVSLVFDEAGKYNYHNHLNASQFGTVVVE